MKKEEKQYYQVLDLFEKGIQSFKENNYTQVDTEEQYKKLMEILSD